MRLLTTSLALLFLSCPWLGHAASPDTEDAPDVYCFKLKNWAGALFGPVFSGELHLTTYPPRAGFFPVFGEFAGNYPQPFDGMVNGTAVLAADEDTLTVSLNGTGLIIEEGKDPRIRQQSILLTLSKKSNMNGSFYLISHDQLEPTEQSDESVSDDTQGIVVHAPEIEIYEVNSYSFGGMVTNCAIQ